LRVTEAIEIMRNYNEGQTIDYRQLYLEGTAARAYDYSSAPAKKTKGAAQQVVYAGSAAPVRREKPVREPKKAHRKALNPDAGRKLFGMILTVAAIVIVGVVMINYVKTQGEYKNIVKTVAAKEVTLNTLTRLNDEEETRINSSIDIRAILTIARDEMGMSYADGSQVIEYTPAENDYMRKVDSSN